MQQPTPKGKTASKLKQHKFVRRHKEFGTSKLEKKFMEEFLDRLGVEYEYQYKAESIGRYYDFRINPNGPIIEIQGTYWHADPRVYEDKNLNRTQRRDRKIDEIKKTWCALHGIKLIYIWEKDINENKTYVMNLLKEELKNYRKRTIIEEKKKQRH